MGFSETLKELLDQGLATSKEIAAKAGTKAQDLGAKGLKASGEIASKAGAKLQELGEKSALSVEIKTLEGQTKKLISLLGAEVYRLSVEGKTVSNKKPEIKKILDQISSVREAMEQKEAELKERSVE